jgi:hypothetical protein
MRCVQRVPDSISGIRENVYGMDSIEWVWDVVEHGNYSQEFGIIRHGETGSTPVVVKVAIPPNLPSCNSLEIIGGGGQSICDNGKHIRAVSGSL